MKMGFLLKNNARKGMGGKGGSKRERKRSAQKGERKEAEKGRGKGGRKKDLQNSRILKRMAGWAEIRKF